MNNIVIKVEGLGKKYLIKHEEQERYKTFQDTLRYGSKKIISSLNPFHRKSYENDKSIEEFWALNNINFEINQGDKVGIIGRNGAGKSTLLKVLSRITEPTRGKIHINGRIASLLEVGTGFHPELTGRENIYLNGAILGMSRQEIKVKFDEIVAFSEVKKFLDTPVKRYSSGMYVRLAFSVAAHLEPEILVVDEVLAVGDSEFQKKCLGKMNDVSKEGRTVLFVSHNIAAIQDLCTRAIVIESGELAFKGSVVDSINKYLSNNKISEGFFNFNNKKTDIAKFSCFETKDIDGKITPCFKSGEPIVFKVSINVGRIIRNPIYSLRISDINGVNIITWRSNDYVMEPLPKRIDSNFTITLTTHDFYLLNGIYDLSIGFADGKEILDTKMKFNKIEIRPSKPNEDFHSITREKSSNSLLYSPAKWVVND